MVPSFIRPRINTEININIRWVFERASTRTHQPNPFGVCDDEGPPVASLSSPPPSACIALLSLVDAPLFLFTCVYFVIYPPRRDRECQAKNIIFQDFTCVQVLGLCFSFVCTPRNGGGGGCRLFAGIAVCRQSGLSLFIRMLLPKNKPREKQSSILIQPPAVEGGRTEICYMLLCILQ